MAYEETILRKACPKCGQPMPDDDLTISEHLRLWCKKTGEK